MKITSLIFIFALLANRLTGAPTTGTASWYGYELAGKPMANTKPFNPEAMTCASWFYPLGSILVVKHQNRSILVTVTDRGPAWRLVRQGRVIDLSLGAFRRLANPRQGLIAVKVERL